MLRCVLSRLFPGVTSFALRRRKEKYDETSVYVFIYGYIYKVIAALRMLNDAICNYCGAVRSLADADTDKMIFVNK
jgi:hypothetical protein